MIKALRVDHRLLHGQVAFSWTQALGADCILLCSDSLIKDELRLQTIKLAKPSGVKVVAKSVDGSIKAIESGITDTYKLFIICENIESAAKVCRALHINSINLGGTYPSNDKREISKSVFVNDEDVALLKQLVEEGVDIYCQQVPANSRENIKTVLK